MQNAPSPTSWRLALPHSAVAVPMARALVRTALAEVAESAERDTAELLTAELVTNAVTHTAGDEPIELEVELRQRSCQVAVHDPAPVPLRGLNHGWSGPVPDPWQEHGRGLVLIRALSTDFGYHLTSAGKVVWFTLPVHTIEATECRARA